ncbi:MAG: glutamate synthase (NADPH), homotetrameric [Chloroflexi bacterium CG_4_9_14_3_um_filter_45_9]|nr:MAG: glutamate synthase (NADPH), homotetrameric [Chloroflexi bacterium CG08_land_8_20_14_0_20_45_12]PIX27473.1 MAG: glutamate synthase (NADPH), homotetrameric [Chloroflexi bacterium CG_4_8_14_3_um_filter_45_15]PJB50158.1 MAG: glutamate synthase (NADPH), homotetrameric [Chloroflexi bacterium CG_4_9_14_3_um_filter_45_9]
MTEKKKINLNRVPIPKQTPELRRRNFNEVALGYTQEQAFEEASRCIQCKKPSCKNGCPVNVEIPEFIEALHEDDMSEAVRILKSKNSLPGICGRVCPQETQCEMTCALAKKGAPVAIGRLERYVADWERAHPEITDWQKKRTKPNNRKVAIVGSGPAGLTCAADLAKLGYEVIIFEALHVAGGVLMYGIPEFRLPKVIVQGEVNYVKALGVEITLDHVIGKIATADELLQNGYNAVFLAPGAGAPMFLNIPGENLSGIYSANEFLTRTNLMKAYLFPEYDTPIKVGKRVVVFGGGNVAMDASRCALRLGAEEVYIIYRRSRVEMPARAEERDNAEEEGVIFKLLTNPKRFIGDEQGRVKAVELYEMELGESDESGRRRPIPKPGSEFIMDIDTAIPALGTTPNPIIPSTTKGLELTKWGTVKTDEATGRTSKEKIWCGGDMATGAATVISAMGAGKRAAADIHAYLKGKTSLSCIK